MKEYKKDDFLLLSGIQHYVFCPRQWALIHIEQQWKENFFTIDGAIMHEHAHNQEQKEKRNGVLVTRGLSIFSRSLGIRGVCDVVEFHEDPKGISLKNHEGQYCPVPVEYKRGKPKEHSADVLQLCAQAMCLEEMLVCKIEKGYLYYGEPRRRTEVIFEESLRGQVREAFESMHQLYSRSHTPKSKKTKACASCSIADVCLPVLNKKVTVDGYLKRMMQEEGE